ncbi:MAG: hypothetical protein F6K25_22260 [Okeania sp. SIO2G4]|uniref:hypothetical protein n=1 Tax=unclassified Okeania TaxID=2634635 RepID=UPI0013BA168A|nr:MULTISPECIES: hypothetical protein [unclassified Okeania]NEP07436.1 hypothetical protein [Okeania sp. SIO4D6]NEP38429.1 hypothetical protein [Okeania sp. SIO2H7]NEP72458.1 hypothetical protein [Okeania sp. SIO2G5]NEP93119.1 hypothetical protein [Okeania sp. SIO2F5]NEQ93240.1 hypothetical protein [Okeania sp. SIO2G4]
MTQNNDSRSDISLEEKLQRLLNILEKVKSNLTGRELAEILWFAVQIEGGKPLQTSTSAQFPKQLFPEHQIEAPSSPSKDIPETSASQTKTEKAAEVYSPKTSTKR